MRRSIPIGNRRLPVHRRLEFRFAPGLPWEWVPPIGVVAILRTLSCAAVMGVPVQPPTFRPARRLDAQIPGTPARCIWSVTPLPRKPWIPEWRCIHGEATAAVRSLCEGSWFREGPKATRRRPLAGGEVIWAPSWVVPGSRRGWCAVEGITHAVAGGGGTQRG